MKIRPPYPTTSLRIAKPLGSLFFCLAMGIFCLWMVAPKVIVAQGIPMSGYWRVLNGDAISLDESTIILSQQPKTSAAAGMGRFAYTEFSFEGDQVALVYTSGRIGDSTATSSQSYWPMDAQYCALAPNLAVLRLATGGCPEYSYRMQDDQLVLQRFTAQMNQLQFQPGTAEFANPQYVEAVMEDVKTHFQCKQFERLLVTMRHQKSEFLARDHAKLQALELERIAVIKRLFGIDSIVARDQLQIHSSIAYDADELSTVAFEFHKVDAWLQNDSLRYEILPSTTAKFANASSTAASGIHQTKVFLTTEQQAVVNGWGKEEWLQHLHDEATDFATSLILYALTGTEVPAWYEIGQMEWKRYGKANDLAKWKPYLAKKFPSMLHTDDQTIFFPTAQ